VRPPETNGAEHLIRTLKGQTLFGRIYKDYRGNWQRQG
jgi:hypothetical protein